jgi:hypothetical protein
MTMAKIDRVGAEVMCDGRHFQTSAPATGNTRILMVVQRVHGTLRRDASADQSPRRPATLETVRVSQIQLQISL